MAHPPRTSVDRSSNIQGIAFLAVVLFVAIGGILVVMNPTRFGLPGPTVATPVTAEASPEASPVP
ncbi:MAG: hypothetical protein ACKOCK_02555 [Chloroflexota bacterium]